MKASIHSNICHVVAVLIAAIFAAACGDATPPIAPSHAGAALLTDVAHMPSAEQGAEKDRTWHNGEEYLLRFPSSGSANENQFTFGCFDRGPDQTAKLATAWVHSTACSCLVPPRTPAPTVACSTIMS